MHGFVGALVVMLTGSSCRGNARPPVTQRAQKWASENDLVVSTSTRRYAPRANPRDLVFLGNLSVSSVSTLRNRKATSVNFLGWYRYGLGVGHFCHSVHSLCRVRVPPYARCRLPLSQGHRIWRSHPGYSWTSALGNEAEPLSLQVATAGFCCGDRRHARQKAKLVEEGTESPNGLTSELPTMRLGTSLRLESILLWLRTHFNVLSSITDNCGFPLFYASAYS